MSRRRKGWTKDMGKSGQVVVTKKVAEPPKDPGIYLMPEVYCQLMFYARNVEKEVGGFGIATIDKTDNAIDVSEVFLMHQDSEAAECTLKSEAIALMYEEMVEQGKDTGSVNFWWHSHADMQVFFSGQDNETLAKWPGDYLIGVCINKKGELKGKIMTRVPLQIMSEVPVFIMWGSPQESGKWTREIAEKVKKVEPKVTTYKGWQGQPGYASAGYQQQQVTEYQKKQAAKAPPVSPNAAGSTKKLSEMTDAEFQAYQEEFYAASHDEDTVIKNELERAGLIVVGKAKEEDEATPLAGIGKGKGSEAMTDWDTE